MNSDIKRKVRQAVNRTGWMVLVGLLAVANSIGATVRSYSTGGVIVSHDTADEGMYYDTPDNEVAYCMSVMRAPANEYFTIYHSEPRKAPKEYPGDSIKTGVFSGVFDYKMPASKGFRLYGTPTDTLSLLYSPEDHSTDGWGGPGNPMVVKGKPGDPYYYMFFVSYTGDDGKRDYQKANFRHYLCQARSMNMVDWDLLTELPEEGVVWKPFKPDSPGEWKRPHTLSDTKGQPIRSQIATKVEDTQGLLGSICYYRGSYYLFYTDVAPNGRAFLYCRTAYDVAPSRAKPNVWSEATRVMDEPLMRGTLVKLAKAHGMDKWAVFYNGYRKDGASLVNDLMLQYTENMKVTGQGGISGLRFYNSWQSGLGVSDKYLGLAGGAVRAQHYFMTDDYGNLATPAQEGQGYTRGGMVFWTNITPGRVYGADVYRAGWNVSRVK